MKARSEHQWPDPKTERLKALWKQGLSQTQIAAAFDDGTTSSAVAGKLDRLGLKRSPGFRELSRQPHGPTRPRRDYTAQEDAYLRANRDLPLEEQAVALSRAKGSIASRRRLLGIAHKEPWAPEKTSLLVEMFRDGESMRAMRARLKLGEARIERKLADLGLRRSPKVSAIQGEALTTLLRLRERKVPIREIARTLGVSAWSVSQESAALTTGDGAVAIHDDTAFVARLLADGGLPRIVPTQAGPILADANNRPWHPPEWWAAA